MSLLNLHEPPCYVAGAIKQRHHMALRGVWRKYSGSIGHWVILLPMQYKSLGGMSFGVFTRLYDSLVQHTMSYGAAFWGLKSHPCKRAVQNREMQVFLGIGKYTPSAAVIGEMGWTTSYIRQWKSIYSHWYRYHTWKNSDMRKRTFNWTMSALEIKCKNWWFSEKNHLCNMGLENYE